jgi:hypothetical protein
MKKKNTTKKKNTKKPIKKTNQKKEVTCQGQAMYGLGVVGAGIYYVSTATGFWIGVLGILKALFWPVFLVYEVLRFVGA